MKKYRDPKSKFAKKSLGQNFLQDVVVRDQILELAGNIEQFHILEIGPGLGFLTSHLIQQATAVTAIEFDVRAVEMLQKEFGHKPNFELITGDFLAQDLDTLFEQKKYSIIANIPYNITNPILRKILENTENQPEFAVLMVQKEVAEKICNPQEKDVKRSILSIAVEVYAEAKYGFTVDRTCFSPAPGVDSAVMRLDIRPAPLVPKEMQRDFFTVVNAGFSEKRKKIGNVLPKFFGVGKPDIMGSIDPDRRAETLSIDEWIELTQEFRQLDL